MTAKTVVKATVRNGQSTDGLSVIMALAQVPVGPCYVSNCNVDNLKYMPIGPPKSPVFPLLFSKQPIQRNWLEREYHLIV